MKPNRNRTRDLGFYVLLLVIIVASCMLPGAMKGVRFLFQPDFSKVTQGLTELGLGPVSSMLCPWHHSGGEALYSDHSKHCSWKTSKQMNCLSKWPWDN